MNLTSRVGLVGLCLVLDSMVLGRYLVKAEQSALLPFSQLTKQAVESRNLGKYFKTIDTNGIPVHGQVVAEDEILSCNDGHLHHFDQSAPAVPADPCIPVTPSPSHFGHVLTNAGSVSLMVLNSKIASGDYEVQTRSGNILYNIKPDQLTKLLNTRKLGLDNVRVTTP